MVDIMLNFYMLVHQILHIVKRVGVSQINAFQMKNEFVIGQIQPLGLCVIGEFNLVAGVLKEESLLVYQVFIRLI